MRILQLYITEYCGGDRNYEVAKPSGFAWHWCQGLFYFIFARFENRRRFILTLVLILQVKIVFLCKPSEVQSDQNTGIWTMRHFNTGPV